MSSHRLSFENVKRQDALSFSKAVAAAQIFEHKPSEETKIGAYVTELLVSFSKPGFLSVSDLATVAVIIRRFAEEGRRVKITWPRRSSQDPTAFEKYLENFQFAQLFERAPNLADWRHRVAIHGRAEPQYYPPDPQRTVHYLPLRWFDRSAFSLPGKASIWHERPLVAPQVERDFRTILLQQNFTDIDTTDLLSRVLFLELAFNAVLHSALNAGEGSGVFGLQIDHSVKGAPLLTFCIADAGRGIPSTLSHAFHEAVRGGDYYPDDNKTTHSNIVRFAFENESSSRLEYPSDIDKEATRGLSLVAESLSKRGSLLITSEGGAVRLNSKGDANTDFDVDDGFSKWPLVGTQITGALRTIITLRKAPHNGDAIRRDSQFGIVTCCEPSGECPILKSADSAQRFVSSLSQSEDILLFDLGYGDAGVRQLEYLCRAVEWAFPDKICIYWNVSTPWQQCRSLDRWLLARDLGQHLPLLFVRGPNDCRFLGFSTTSDPSLLLSKRPNINWYANFLAAAANRPRAVEGEVGQPLDLVLDDYMAIASRANTEHIVNGFRKNEISSGFFTGRIHLLSTRTVTKYFAFSTQLVASPDANLKRWLFASVAGLNKLLLISERKSARHPVILAFAWPMRQLLGHLPKQLSVKASIHGLLPYDVPTREEISSYVHPGDDVYLLTDVVATGSLVNAVAASVIENSAQVRGVITLVDNREDLPANRAEIRLGRQQVPFVSVADFPRGKAEPLSKDQEYWVDPVTLVPQPQRPWGWDATLDPRIGDTIRLTVASKAVRCGHTIDGARHTSVYVDMRALLDADTGEVGKQVRSVFDRRMSTRGWSDFAPHVILYPAGIRRIETVASVEELDPAQLEELSIYATAVGLYCDRLRLIWGDTLLRGEVPRAFDPGGGARCSGQIFFQNGTPHNGQWRDVIIADDGMWRGTTMAALIRLAIAHGAQRIVAIPLLARMAPREVETIEAIVSVEGQPNDSAVEVCFVLPFLLPIPFYSANECPYESTQRRFRDREWFSETVRRLADSISHTLDGHHPIDAASQSPLYINAWLRLRSLVELASDNERALSELGDTIESLSNDDALLAMFTLFLEEWRLLGKARLRQTIAPRVKLRATQALREASPSNIKIAALSLLRSQFTDDFIEALDTIADQAVEDISLLERTLLHIATLTAAQRKSEECIRFLDRIQDNGPAMASRSHLAEKELTHYMNLIGACGAMTLEHRVARDVGDLSPRRAAIRAIEIIMDDDFLRHEIRAFINPLAKRGDSLIELSPRTFSLQAKDWKERYLVYLSDGLVAVLERFRPCLLQMSMQRDANASHIQYLTSSRPGAPRLTEDLVMLGFALDFLAMGAKHSLSISSLSQSAKRLATHLLNPECTLVQLIDSISHNTVAAFLTSYKDRVVERLTLAFGQDAIDVGIEGVAGIDQSRRLFVPKDMLDASATHILHNLESKAFFPASNETVGGKPKVLLSVATRRNAADDPCLVLTVKNNGNELVREVELGPRAKRAARNMQLFGGTLERPHAIEEHPWRVAQTMVVCLW